MKNKSCPFCGNMLPEEFAIRTDPKEISRGSKKPMIVLFYSFNCSCGASGPDAYTRQEAIDKWNRRK